jgi:AsmA protein
MRRIARLTVVVVVFGVAVLVAAVVPNLVSSDYFKQRIADRIAELTGRAVTLNGDSSLSIYPHLAVSVGDLTIANREGMGDDPFIAADTVTTRLRVLPLLIGRVELDEFDLSQPRIHLVVDEKGDTNWRVPQSEVTAAAAPPPTAAGAGRIVLTNGTIIYDDLASDRHEEMTNVDLDLSWPQAEGLSGTGTLQWRGETIEFSGAVAKPSELAAGDPSPVRFAIGSTPLRVSFNGTLSGLDNHRFQGEASLTTSSLRRTIEWLGTPMGSGAILGAASIKGDIDWLNSTMSFTNATVELDGNSAEGSLSARFGNGWPAVRATLSTAKLDLSPYVEAMRADLVADGPVLIAPTRLPIAEGVDVALDMSAQQVLIGTLRIGPARLAASTKDGKASLKIEEAQFYGGRLEGDVIAAMDGETLSASAHANLAAVPARAALSDLADISALGGTGAAVIDVNGRGQNWGEFAQSINGTVMIALADGSLSGVDVNALAALATHPAIVPLGVGEASTGFTSMAGTLSIGGGTLETDDLVAEGKDYRVSVSGWGSLVSGIVNATATLATAGNDPREVPLRIGGTWWAPEFTLDQERIGRDGEASPRG